MAPEVGFEPTTNRLTADRSTTELLWINHLREDTCDPIARRPVRGPKTRCPRIALVNCIASLFCSCPHRRQVVSPMAPAEDSKCPDQQILIIHPTSACGAYGGTKGVYGKAISSKSTTLGQFYAIVTRESPQCHKSGQGCSDGY